MPVNNIKQYSIRYSETAEEDIIAKAEYIENVYHDTRLAYTWYTRLRKQLQQDLSFMPYKYSLYSAGIWAEKGIREYIYRNDIVLYSVDETASSVVILAVFTKGKNIADDIADK